MIAALFIPGLLFFLVRTLAARRIQLGHLETFTFGFLVYCGVPLTLSLQDLRGQDIVVQLWSQIANIGGVEPLHFMIIWSTAFWLAFVSGSLLVRRRILDSRAPEPRPGSPVIYDKAAWRMVLIGLTALFFLFGLFWAVQNRGLLFRGYVGEFATTSIGPLQTTIFLMTMVMLFAAALRRHIGSGPLMLTILVMIVLAVLSLSVGTRQALTVTFVAVLTFLSMQRKGVPRGGLIVAGILVFSLFALVSIWRVGAFEPQAIFLLPAYEPMFTFFSAVTYTTYNDIPAFAAPIPLAAAFMNLVPSALWPGKVDLLSGILADYTIISPLGATHVIVSMLINFGWAGALVIGLLGGMAARKLQEAATRNPLIIPSSALLVGVLASDFWRNAFQNAIVKSLFQAGTLFPLMLILMVALLTWARRSARQADVADTASP
jgi:hypothetical protein